MNTLQQDALRRLRNAAYALSLCQPGMHGYSVTRFRDANRALALAQLAAAEAGFSSDRINRESDASRNIL